MTTTFYFEDGQDNVYNEQGKKVFDPMEDVLTQVTDPNIVLETVTNRKSYLSNLKPVPKTIPKEKVANRKPKKPVPKTVYNDYSDRT
jgi:hypothetical protein